MDFIPPNAIGPIVATAITLLVTYFVAFFNGVRDKNFVLLERYLKLKKDMGDEQTSTTLNELIRRRLNSYVVAEMDGRDRRKRNVHIIYALGMCWGLFFTMGIVSLVQKEYISLVIYGVISFFFLWLWSEQADKGRIRDFENSVLYKANFVGGKSDNRYAKIPLLRPSFERNAPGTWQYPDIYIQDINTGIVDKYEQISSSGYINSDTKRTTLEAEYQFIGEVKMKRKWKKSKAFISSGSLYDNPEPPLSLLLQK